MDLFTVLRNIYLKIKKNINVERITNSEIDDAFGEAAGTGTDAQDYVVEHYQNSDGGSGYVKWASGRAEVFKRFSKSLSATTKWNSMYYTLYTDRDITYSVGNFSGFVDYPVVNVTLQSSGGNIICLAGDYSTYTYNDYGNYYVFCSGSVSNMWCTINIHAIGRWK